MHVQFKHYTTVERRHTTATAAIYTSMYKRALLLLPLLLPCALLYICLCFFPFLKNEIRSSFTFSFRSLFLLSSLCTALQSVYIKQTHICSALGFLLIYTFFTIIFLRKPNQFYIQLKRLNEKKKRKNERKGRKRTN